VVTAASSAVRVVVAAAVSCWATRNYALSLLQRPTPVRIVRVAHRADAACSLRPVPPVAGRPPGPAGSPGTHAPAHRQAARWCTGSRSSTVGGALRAGASWRAPGRLRVWPVREAVEGQSGGHLAPSVEDLRQWTRPLSLCLLRVTARDLTCVQVGSWSRSGAPRRSKGCSTRRQCGPAWSLSRPIAPSSSGCKPPVGGQ